MHCGWPSVSLQTAFFVLFLSSSITNEEKSLLIQTHSLNLQDEEQPEVQSDQVQILTKLLYFMFWYLYFT